ncbi:MAG TPA: choice-of-anchor tandem repeat GloVer-containing protein [Candidatus Cybelea sp.]|jgi:uncharacterized repeat protein (TIGR03803 family)|nr:choice-of-anchor tandem repeat GloVer-containing protein [Candidatus Cybelea sp.]
MLYRFSVCALLLALPVACAHQTAVTPFAGAAPSVQVRHAASAYRLIYSFQGQDDGAKPYARLAAWDGKLYGTTKGGGGRVEHGTVFVIDSDGTERVLHAFTSAYGDGGTPMAGLVHHGKELYGTTTSGGSSSKGTVFEINTDGKLRIVFNFNGANGAYPRGDLVDLFGTLYGTTENGGTHNQGTVFSVTPDGNEQVLHSFSGGADGANPYSGLELLDNHLYGTTIVGGAKDVGTVFEIAPDRKERVLYSFLGGAGNNDGWGPEGKLVALNGVLYGTTRAGGANCCGTIFEVKRDGTERIVHSLSENDGTSPIAGLAALNGALYGTAPSGGTKRQGTIFEVKPDGAFQVMHTFGIREGADPRSSLIAVNGKLYGTTAAGGAKQKGTVYELTP